MKVVERRVSPDLFVANPERSRQYRKSGVWNDDTLAGAVTRHAQDAAAKIAIVDLAGQREHTYAELDQAANRVANFLLEVGVSAGDVVAVQLPNWYDTAVVDIGAWKIGAVVNPMLPIYRGRELKHMLSVGSVGVVFTPSVYRRFDHVALMNDLRGDLPSLHHHIAVEDPEVDPDWFDRWAAANSDAPPIGRLDAAAVSELMYTSGTEAEPKAIMHTEQTAGFSMRAAQEALGLRDGDVVWAPSPIGHSTGLNWGLRIALTSALTLVLQDRWSAEEAARLVERYGCSFTVAATTFLRDLVEHATRHGCDVSSLRLFCSGGAPVPLELVSAAEQIGVTTLRLYGSTEALTVTCNRPGSPREKRLSTDGCALPNVEIEVRSESGVALVGEPGEIFVRSPGASVGFFADSERTLAAFTADGWLRSGDLGVLDDEGYLTIVGRKKEIIIRGGLNIAPRELEEALIRHDAIADVAVVGLSDERLGEIACACIVARNERTITLDEVVQHLKAAGLATYKLPERVLLVDELPRTSTGKVQKHLLRLQFEREAGMLEI